MIDVRRFGSELVRDEQGIWFAPHSGKVSYPKDGHAACLAVEEGSFWFRHRNRCILAAVRRYLPADRGPIFDIGGGNGFVARGLAEVGYEVVLVEPGPQGARNAKRRGLANVVCATIEAADFLPHSLPAIGLFDVVEHVADDRGFLSSMSTLLEPGGWIFITVPAYPWLWSQEDMDAGHFRRYTRASILAVLDACGLQVEFLSSFFRPLPLPILILRALPHRLGIRRTSALAAKGRREHAIGGGPLPALLDQMLRAEVANIEAEHAMTMGGSILVVARRGPPAYRSERAT